MLEIGARDGIADHHHHRPGKLGAVLKCRQVGERAVKQAAIAA